MTFPRRDAPPVDSCTAEAHDRFAPPRTPQRFAPSTYDRAADRVIAEHHTHQGDAPTAEDIRARARAHEARHPPAAVASVAVDPGRILARLPRHDGTELRVSLHTYQGKPFARVAVWQSSAPDAWPVKGKGVAVKVREIPSVAAALADAMDATDDTNGGDR